MDPGDRPVPEAPDHGLRLSAEEFERRIVALYDQGPALPDRDEERRLRRAEFELRIDHRLGQHFPPERRERLWAVQQRFDRLRYWHLFKGLFARGGDVSGPLATSLIRAYATELDEAELRCYFELSDGDARRVLGDRMSSG